MKPRFTCRLRARTTIEDFVLSYFPLHGLSSLKDFLRFIDVLVYVEASIYQLDEENEDLVSRFGTANAEQEVPACSANDADTTAGARETIIYQVLRSKSLLDDKIQEELDAGRRYWQLEREVCQQMAVRRGSLLTGTSTLMLEVVHTASEAKSFDYRVLHLLLFRLIPKEYDAPLLRFLKVDETLLDIGDDLVDYEDDVLRNSFNIYRAYIHLFGRDAQLKLVERISSLEQQHQVLLEQLPLEVQQRYKQRQKEAAEEPGSEKWVFPAPIYDEHAYREQVGSGDSDS